MRGNGLWLGNVEPSFTKLVPAGERSPGEFPRCFTAGEVELMRVCCQCFYPFPASRFVSDGNICANSLGLCKGEEPEACCDEPGIDSLSFGC